MGRQGEGRNGEKGTKLLIRDFRLLASDSKKTNPIRVKPI